MSDKTVSDWEATMTLRYNAARVLQQLWARRTVEICDIKAGGFWGQRIEGRETEWRDVPSEAAHIHTLATGHSVKAGDTLNIYMGSPPTKIPFLSRYDALALKDIAENVLNNPDHMNTRESERDMAVPCLALLSLIEQSYSPNLGLATTGRLLEEIRTRIEVHSPGWLDYRTVDGEEQYLKLRATR